MGNVMRPGEHSSKLPCDFLVPFVRSTGPNCVKVCLSFYILPLCNFSAGFAPGIMGLLVFGHPGAWRVEMGLGPGSHNPIF